MLVPPGRGRRRVTFSNATSLVALFVALGGSAYATGLLPANSVGRAQLQPNSVTTSKLAPKSVGRAKLKPGSVAASELADGSVDLGALQASVRRLLKRPRASTGPRGAAGQPGPAGAAGSQGTAGASGPGAARIHYLEQASTSPSPHTIFDLTGIRLEGRCEDLSPGTQLDLSLTTSHAVTGTETISFDSGPGTPGGAEANTANLQISLPEGTADLGGPSTPSGEYSRVFAHFILVAPDKTVDFTIVLVLDGTAGTCSIDGVAVPAA